MCKVTINENGLNVEGGELKIFDPKEIGEKYKCYLEAENKNSLYLKNISKIINKQI